MFTRVNYGARVKSNLSLLFQSGAIEGPMLPEYVDISHLFPNHKGQSCLENLASSFLDSFIF